MSCKAIRERILDLALDEDMGDTAVRAHLDSCAVCRNELAARRALLAAIDRVLVEELREEPSPVLAARVRQAILNEEPRRPASWQGATWKGWVPAAATVALALLVGLAVRARLTPSVEPAPIESAHYAESKGTALGQSSSETHAPGTGAVGEVGEAPIREVGAGRRPEPRVVGSPPPAESGRLDRPRAADASRTASRTRTFPDVIVPAGEMPAVLRLSAASAVHPLLVRAPEEGEAAANQPLEPLSIEKLEIAPLLLKPLEVDVPAATS